MSVDKATQDNIVKEIADIQSKAVPGPRGASYVDDPTASTQTPAFDAGESEAEELAGDDGTDAESSDLESQAAAPKSGVLKSKLSTVYQLDDDVEEEELADALLEQLKRLQESNKEAERRALEAEQRAQEALAKIKEREEKPAPKAETEDKPAAKTRRLAPITPPDPELNALCEYDAELKRFVGKEKFGSVGAEAANKLNAYKAARDQRFEMLVSEDFTSIIRDEMRDEIERIADEKAKAYLEQLQAEQKKVTAATQAEKQEAEFVGFMETIKDKLYKVGPNGEIKKNLITGDPEWTDTGNRFRDIYVQLQEVNPNASQATLVKKAYDIVSKFSAPVEPPKDTKQETAEKKKRFLEKRKHESGVPTGSANVATTKDKFSSGNKVSLLSAMLEDPDNEDNPDLAQLR